MVYHGSGSIGETVSIYLGPYSTGSALICLSVRSELSHMLVRTTISSYRPETLLGSSRIDPGQVREGVHR